MKKACLLGCVFLWVASSAFSAEFKAPSSLTKKTPSTRTAGEVLKPVPTGAIYLGTKHGLQVINPLAPASLGKGEKILTKKASLEARPADARDDHKPFGGISFFGWEF